MYSLYRAIASSVCLQLPYSRRTLFAAATTPLLLTATTAFSAMANPNNIRLVLYGGDTMLGRAVQLTFPTQSPGEEWIRDSCTAQHYLSMALHHDESDLGTIRRQNGSGGSYLWGDLASLKIAPPPDIRVMNLETAVTRTIDNRDVPDKGINYHMHTDNVQAVLSEGLVLHTVGSPSPPPLVVSCANNHILDYGRTAFQQETLSVIRCGNFLTAGCGASLAEASSPAVITTGGRNVQIFAFATGCSGTPHDWWAGPHTAGLVGLPGLYTERDVAKALDICAKAFDTAGAEEGMRRIVSIHWGPNWAGKGEHDGSREARRAFAHSLIDKFHIDVIYGHSSHHMRGQEVYKGKLILYGTGDLVNDYEGFANLGEEQYNKLGGVYVVDMDSTTGKLTDLRIVPFFMNRLRLERYTTASRIWDPNSRQMREVPGKSKDLCKLLNDYSSLIDAAPGCALLLEHLDSDPQVRPSGPVIKAVKPFPVMSA
jgi:poly-gamma-glutamate capsule biosynthesis protein CapA/YwtB (metallophosphatase superfamily)